MRFLKDKRRSLHFGVKAESEMHSSSNLVVWGTVHQAVCYSPSAPEYQAPPLHVPLRVQVNRPQCRA